MVIQYPDHIAIKISGSPYQDANHNWIMPEPELFQSECRAEPNSANAIVKTGDGAEKYYDFNVYMPRTSKNIPVGSEVELTLHDGWVAKSMVKRASNGQLNSRLWV